MDIAPWLESLGLEQYEQAFRDNAIDAELLSELTDAHLKEMGIPLGHRLRLLKAIAALAAPHPSPADTPKPASGDKQPHEAERRQLTVMFCDLVGSTALSARMDPEDLRAVIGAYHATILTMVERFGGFVAKYLGDGVLVYFGWPQAHEEDAERAIRAALAVLETVGQAVPAGERLTVRIGIATGLAVVGDLLGAGAAQEQAVVGETPNLAARLQSLAEPGCAVIDAETRRRIGGLFDCRELGAVHLKGLPGPVRAWQVLGEAVVQSRFEAMRAASLAPLVGREDELDLLLRRWRQAKESEGQVVLISGEPGIGKSRLIAALEERLAGEAPVKFKYFCSPHHRDSALQPIIARWENEAGFVRGEPADARLDKLEALLLPLGATQEEVALIAEMLGVPGGERYPPLDLSPQRKKEQTFEALSRILASRARRTPVLMLFEDAHWADPSSLELLDRVIGQLAGFPVLLIISYRSEFQAPWVGHAGVSLIALSRLSPRQAAALATQVVVGQALPAGMLERIVAQTDGVPLFIEELTKAVLEGAGQADAAVLTLPVPSTLQASLMARLDRLPTAKQVAQIGAVIGREFGYELLAAVAGLPEATLTRGLEELAGAGLAFRRGTPPEATYTFKHALVQDAAYGTLLRTRRQELHARIAAVLEERFPEMIEQKPELLAHHCAHAGLLEKAIAYWGRAGRQALARSAMIEAVAQLRKGLDLLPGLPDDHERWQHELELQSLLGAALVASKGNSAPETGQAYARARELCEQLGDTTALVPVLSGLTTHYQTRSEYGAMRRIAEDLLRLGQQQNDTASLLVGHRSMGLCLHNLGDFTSARVHFERVLSLYVPETHHSLATIAAFDMRSVALTYLSWELLILGYPEQAGSSSAQALTWSRNLRHPHNLAFSLAYAALLEILWQSVSSGEELLDELISLTTEHRFPVYLAMAKIMRGHVLASRSSTEEGLTLIRGGLSDRVKVGASWNQTYFLGLLALSYENAGQADEALNQLDMALEVANRTGERWFEAELHRLKAEWLIAHCRGGLAEAEACFYHAISVAQEQRAKLWELRAVTSLARLWRDQGRHGEARDLLAPVYGWFTEGFATSDLKDAKALLNELRE